MEEQRSRKRLRLSSESADYIPLLTEEDLEAEFKHHPTYWFDDGNVIIVAEEIGFKVYRDFLKACPSRVSQLLVGSNADEVAVGLPSICHVSEEALNIEILLRWVFQAMRDSDVEPTSVPECSRFFFVASKYELSGLMKQATAFLERTFVHRLDQFDTLQYRPSSLANHIVGAFLARRYGINHLLPAALLWCCTIQLNKLPSVIDEAHRSINVRGISWIEEEVWLLRVCVSAALDIQALPVLVNISGLAPTDTCPSNAVCSEVLAALKSDAKLATLNPLISFDRLGNFKRRLKQPCTACREMWSQQYEKQRNEIWETLPLRFGLPPWKELLKRG